MVEVFPHFRILPRNDSTICGVGLDPLGHRPAVGPEERTFTQKDHLKSPRCQWLPVAIWTLITKEVQRGGAKKGHWSRNHVFFLWPRIAAIRASQPQPLPNLFPAPFQQMSFQAQNQHAIEAVTVDCLLDRDWTLEYRGRLSHEKQENAERCRH